MSLPAALAVTLMACGPPHPTASSAPPEARLIPRQVLFAEPERTALQLSPEGSHLAWVAPYEGVSNLWVAPVDDPGSARAVTREADPVFIYAWPFTGRHLLFLRDRQGDENYHLYRVDLDGSEVTDLTPIEGVNANRLALSSRVPNEAVILLNERDPSYHDLYRVDLATGARRLVVRNDEGFAAFTTDGDLEPRLASRDADDGATEVFLRRAGRWESWDRIPYEDALTTAILGFDGAGSKVFLLDSRGRDTAAVVEVELASGRRRLLSENPRADAERVLRHPTRRHVQAVAYTYERRAWETLDAAVAADLEELSRLGDGELDVVSGSLDDRRWLVSLERGDRPLDYYLWDREQRQARYLFAERSDLDGYPLAPMRSVVIPARDGLELVSYLTLPPESDPDADGRPTAPLPLVLLVHGGPWDRDSWGFDPEHQLFANRGYAVLSVNFRGSTGLGKRFLNAGNREWGGKMQDDLVDAVEWAVAGGLADRDRVAIMGVSYGGYAAMMGLARTPELFAAGVNFVGPSSLETFMASIPAYWAPYLNLLKNRVGDPTTDEGLRLLRQHSPLTHAGDISRPLLVGQGANDPRVRQSESDQIVAALRDQGVPVTYLLFGGEGHSLGRPESAIAFYAAAEAFLALHLDGRSQPLGAGDFADASLEVVGAEAVPGLAGALAAASSAVETRRGS